ncbi:heparinase II/III family protein [Gammaproteobacteria bacterium]|nr:heparinase II/III family protein [Gammaproteobacteria bacterium]
MPNRFSFTNIRSRFRDKFYRLIYRSPLYLFTLIGPTPKRLLGTPPELILGNKTTGQLILAGSLITANERWPFTDFTNIPRNASSNWQAYLHGFSWLSDLRALESSQARLLAREHVLTWLNTYKKWSSVAWQADILGQRLTNWIIHFGFFSKDASQEFHDLFFLETIKQVRHLNRSVIKTITGSKRIKGLKGLIYSGISLPNCESYQKNGLRLLETELQHQIYPDGGHYSRNPKTHMKVLTDLVAIRDTLITAHIETPNWLTAAIGRMVPILRTFRHVDGGLVFFNGSNDSNSKIIDMLLLKSNIKTKAILSAPHTGFQRLQAGKTTVLIDTGSPPNLLENKWAHAGTLAFEMSSGKDRIITNCGMPENVTAGWRQALRSTAAHSTIIVDSINSSEIAATGGFSHEPGQVTSSRREIDGSTIIEASYDGYSKLFGLIHRRLIMLAPDGGEIQGEDNLIGPGGQGYSLRFHLHPNVQATVLQDNCAAILKPRRGAGWRFTCINRIITVEDSIYFDNSLSRRKSQQILVSASLGKNGDTIKWRLSRI